MLGLDARGVAVVGHVPAGLPVKLAWRHWRKYLQPLFGGAGRGAGPLTNREYLFRENSFPLGVFLMTGTGIVPPDEFSLAAVDRVRITIDPIGTLENEVIQGKG